MAINGKITAWDDEKGFGFIVPDRGTKKVFVHINAFANRTRRPQVNQPVSFSLSTDKQGRSCAVNAVLAGDKRKQKSTSNSSTLLTIIVAMLFLLIVGASVLSGKIPSLIFLVYIAASLLTFTAYAIDKSAAQKGAWRTQESTLHLLSLAGGWPGALIAQQTLRHKSKKQPFRIVFWITALLNCSVCIWLLTPAGSAKIQLLIANLISTTN